MQWSRHRQQVLISGPIPGQNMNVVRLTTSLPYLALNAIRLRNGFIIWKFSQMQLQAMSGEECA